MGKASGRFIASQDTRGSVNRKGRNASTTKINPKTGLNGYLQRLPAEYLSWYFGRAHHGKEADRPQRSS